MVADGRLPAPRLLRLEIDDEALRKRLGNKAGADFDQLLKDYHREMDMLQVYFPGAQIINVDATGTRKTVAERVRKAISEQVPVKTPS